MAEKISISLLPVKGGDCIHIRFMDDQGKFRNILIDGGLNAGYRNALKNRLSQIKAKHEEIDLLIVTHIDDDHIGGILAWFKNREKDNPDLPIHQIWFNSGEMIAENFSQQLVSGRNIELRDEGDKSLKSIPQGITLESYIKEHLNTHQIPISALQVHQISNCKITILSPNAKQLEKLDKAWETELNKPDKDEKSLMARELRQQKSIPDSLLTKYERDDKYTNGSSIAFLMEIDGFKAIFSGDAPSESIVESLKKLGYGPQNPLRLNLLKVSHHGSQNNTSTALVSSIQCDQYCFSSDGIKHGHPDIESIARILTSPAREPGKPIQLAFNYQSLASLKMIQPTDAQQYNFETRFPIAPGEPLELSF